MVVLAVFMPLIASAGCTWDVEVGAGERCSHEGWWGPFRVCPEGYWCDDLASWTCQPRGGAGPSTPSFVPSPSKSDASCAIDANDGSAESDGEAEVAAAADATVDADGIPADEPN